MSTGGLDEFRHDKRRTIVSDDQTGLNRQSGQKPLVVTWTSANIRVIQHLTILKSVCIGKHAVDNKSVKPVTGVRVVTA